MPTGYIVTRRLDQSSFYVMLDCLRTDGVWRAATPDRRADRLNGNRCSYAVLLNTGEQAAVRGSELRLENKNVDGFEIGWVTQTRPYDLDCTESGIESSDYERIMKHTDMTLLSKVSRSEKLLHLQEYQGATYRQSLQVLARWQLSPMKRDRVDVWQRLSKVTFGSTVTELEDVE